MVSVVRGKLSASVKTDYSAYLIIITLHSSGALLEYEGHFNSLVLMFDWLLIQIFLLLDHYSPEDAITAFEKDEREKFKLQGQRIQVVRFDISQGQSFVACS